MHYLCARMSELRDSFVRAQSYFLLIFSSERRKCELARIGVNFQGFLFSPLLAAGAKMAMAIWMIQMAQRKIQMEMPECSRGVRLSFSRG